jgi:hypothetical protein
MTNYVVDVTVTLSYSVAAESKTDAVDLAEGKANEMLPAAYSGPLRFKETPELWCAEVDSADAEVCR